MQLQRLSTPSPCNPALSTPSCSLCVSLEPQCLLLVNWKCLHCQLLQESFQEFLGYLILIVPGALHGSCVVLPSWVQYWPQLLWTAILTSLPHSLLFFPAQASEATGTHVSYEKAKGCRHVGKQCGGAVYKVRWAFTVQPSNPMTIYPREIKVYVHTKVLYQNAASCSSIHNNPNLETS